MAQPTPSLAAIRADEPAPLKRTPIAILSLSAPVVPYPSHLVKSLQLLMPHLATSLDLAQQYTNVSGQSDAQHQRSRVYGNRRGTLGELDETEIDVSNDSLTSPSEYSGRSRQSPGGSTGTPGWDHGNFGLSNAKAVPGTPGVHSATEMIESYFDTKRKHELPSTSTTQDSSQENAETESGQSAQQPRKGESVYRDQAPANLRIRSRSTPILIHICIRTEQTLALLSRPFQSPLRR